MSQDYDNRVRYVYAQLKALVENLPEIAFDRDVDRYHLIIDELRDLGFDAERFRIDPERDMFRPVASSNSSTGIVRRHNYTQVYHGAFDRQVKALFNYFQLIQTHTQVRVELPKVDGE